MGMAWGNLLAGHLLVSFSCGHLLVGSITWPKLLVDICLLGQILVGHLLVGKCLWTFTCRTFPCGTFTCNHHFAWGNFVCVCFSREFYSFSGMYVLT